MVVYAFVMHVSVYMLLCRHCRGYGYACMVGQACIVRSLYALGHHDAIGFYDANVLVKIEQEMKIIKVKLQLLDLKARACLHTGLYVGHTRL